MEKNMFEVYGGNTVCGVAKQKWDGVLLKWRQTWYIS